MADNVTRRLLETETEHARDYSAYNVYDKATTTATGNHKKGDIVDPIVKVPTVIAQYYVNPANAKIDLKEGDPVTFVYHDAEYLQTSNADMVPQGGNATV